MDPKLSRRTLLKGLGVTLGSTVIGCDGCDGAVAVRDGDEDAGLELDASTGPTTDAGTIADAGSAVDAGTRVDAGAPDAGAPVDAGRDAGTPPSVDAGQPNACTSQTELSPAQLLAPIDTIVVLMMENRSFDHYLGALRLVEGRMIDGLTGTEWNPSPGGGSVGIHQLNDFTPADPPHDWGACHAQWNFGANDGFVIAHAGASQNDVMGYHVRSQLPTTYALADAGTICERWYSSVMGPTWPNRFFLHGATSNGLKANLPLPFGAGYTSIFEALGDAGVSHANYYHDIPWALGAYQKTSGNRNMAQFFTDAATGNLPSFCVIDPQFFGAGANDDHPDHDVQLGQALLATVYAALGASPQWSRMLFVITYDEHGGFFDHVAPPTVNDTRVDFQQLGFRVPSLVLGPYVRTGCSVTGEFEHVSVLKTLQVRFGLSPLNERMNSARDLSSCIDPAKIPAPAAAASLPVLTLDKRRMLARAPSSHAHAELAEAVRRITIPPGLDRRSAGIGEAAHVLRRGQELGVLRMR